ncbi:MAG: DUF805 domain-containing protein [Pseudomonadota bacterium]
MRSFKAAIVTCFSKYITFSGRARRAEYWWFVLFIIVGGIVFSFADEALFGTDPSPGGQNYLLSNLFQLGTLLPLLAAGWRRMHDTGRPGWYLFFPLVALLALVVIMFALGFLFPSEGGPNETQEAAGSALENPYLTALGDLFSTGFMIASGLVAIVPYFVVLFWLCQGTEDAENRYGPVPPLLS